MVLVHWYHATGYSYVRAILFFAIVELLFLIMIYIYINIVTLLLQCFTHIPPSNNVWGGGGGGGV